VAADCMSSTYSHRRNGKRTILHDSLTSRSRAVTVTPVNMRERERETEVIVSTPVGIVHRIGVLHQ
jgi:hypothetical protein